jgi:PilZ domain-containing protein
MSLILNATVVEEPIEDVAAPVEGVEASGKDFVLSALATIEGRPVIRASERCSADFPVKIFARGGAGAIMGRSSDLGSGGMGFYAPVQLALDEEVHLHFTMPHSRIAFGIAGKVRDVNGYRFGVEFEGLTASERTELLRIVRLLRVKT